MENIVSMSDGFSPGLAVLVCAAYFVIDALYAKYTYAVVERKPMQAANIGFIMHFLLAFGVINYVGNFLYVIPLALGSWLGTYMVVKRERDGKVA